MEGPRLVATFLGRPKLLPRPRPDRPAESIRNDKSPLPVTSAGRSTLVPEPSWRRPCTPWQTPVRSLVLIPAYNEARSLPAVVAEVRHEAPGADVLVVDDGSDDGTAEVLPELGVRWLRLPVRLGPGAAVRAGLRYAHSRGYQAVVRLDGDGQHPAALISVLLAPICRREADIVIGSRYKTERRPTSVPFVRRLLHYMLGRILSVVTGRLVTDGTSGLWAFGPRALKMLAEHHPSGYPEPELVMFVSRNALRVEEVAVEMRERMAGVSSLTLRRTGAAMARLLLHLVVVPFRSSVKERQ